MKTFYQRGMASVIIDGQYGSTGKGLLAGYLAVNSNMEHGHVVHTTNAAPNAGHTTVWTEPGSMGEPDHVKKLVTFHLPTGGVMRRELCYINAGAVIDMGLLVKEVKNAVEIMGSRMMVQVDPNAVILQSQDVESEMLDGSTASKISSTRKGVGSAIARKARREADLMSNWRTYDPNFPIKVQSQELSRLLMHGRTVSVEVPQGLSLGLNYGGFYPYCTSREVSISQALADAGIHPRHLGMVALCMRTFPIRVGSLPGGTSGGHYHDQTEITWDQLPVSEPETTTVTKRPRRVFTWSRNQYRDALYKTLPAIVFLNFCNYFQSVQEFEGHVASMHEDHDMVGVKPMLLFGFGPMISDVVHVDGARTAMERILSGRPDRKAAD